MAKKSPVKIYCHSVEEDQAFLSLLKKYLIPLQREGLITIQSALDIRPGDVYQDSILRYLNTAHIILILVSPAFLASDHSCGKEMERALKRHTKKEAHVIPLLLSSTLLASTPLAPLQPLPMNKKPVEQWSSQNEALIHVVEHIKQVVLTVQLSPENPQPPRPEKATGISTPQKKDPQTRRKTRESSRVEAPPVGSHNNAPRPVTTISAGPKKEKHQAPARPNSPVTFAQPEQHEAKQINQNTFTSPVHSVIAGGSHHTINIHSSSLPVEDPLTKALEEKERGYQALKRKEYLSARHCLEAADHSLPEDRLPDESAQIKYALALTLLNGQRPFDILIATMRQIEQLLMAAIRLWPLHSYYYTLAIVKCDFARNGLPHFKHHAQNLRQKAQRINKRPIDNENLHLLRICQPRLMHDAQQW